MLGWELGSSTQSASGYRPRFAKHRGAPRAPGEGPEGRRPGRGRRRQDGRPQRGEQAAGQEDPERVEGGPGPDGGAQEAVAVQDERYRAVGDEDEADAAEQSVQGEQDTAFKI